MRQHNLLINFFTAHLFNFFQLKNENTSIFHFNLNTCFKVSLDYFPSYFATVLQINNINFFLCLVLAAFVFHDILIALIILFYYAWVVNIWFPQRAICQIDNKTVGNKYGARSESKDRSSASPPSESS